MFADVLRNGCSYKIFKIRRKTPVPESPSSTRVSLIREKLFHKKFKKHF